ncbi:MAG: DUF3179 domain-containing (seleno)protein, partial [Anaerolineales bacterium]|nr:DUF3179 domain-containing (seleno)protein [Anaerolineales bacterium]
MKPSKGVLVVLIIAVVAVLYFALRSQVDLPDGETVPFSQIENDEENNVDDINSTSTTMNTEDTSQSDDTQPSSNTPVSSREIFVTDGVKHSILIDEIRQGCFAGRDCIPSVDAPVFMSRDDADDLLPEDTIGIGLSFKGEDRFYPFNMLVTREIVNDVVAGKPLIVTYCPLCGTGIVFNREIDGEVFEFGVSGLLWQSNLLMYNREDSEEKISLWSQVLGEAVVGNLTGTKLEIIPSDVVRYTDWRVTHPKTVVLNTGRIGDPYNGNYYGVTSNFSPNFNEDESPLSPTEYVFGIELKGQHRAYVRDTLSIGETEDNFAGE